MDVYFALMLAEVSGKVLGVIGVLLVLGGVRGAAEFAEYCISIFADFWRCYTYKY